MRPDLKKYVVAAIVALALAFAGLATAFAATNQIRVHSDTTNTTSTSTGTTTTGNLPPPYDKPPRLSCSGQTIPYELHRSKVRSFYLVSWCGGLAKQASLQLTGLPKGSSFIGRGSRETTCTVNANGPIRCWQKKSYQMVNGIPTWQEINLTPRRQGKQLVWTVIVHIRLSRSAPLGRHIFDMLAQATNGNLTLSPDDQNAGGGYTIKK